MPAVGPRNESFWNGKLAAILRVALSFLYALQLRRAKLIANVLLLLLVLTRNIRANDELEKNDCGCRCLYIAMSALLENPQLSLSNLIEDLKPDNDGTSIGQLEQVAVRVGLNTLAVETSLEALQSRRRPFVAIAHLNHNHFVVISGIDNEGVTTIDPPAVRAVSKSAFESEWSGNVLLLSTQPLEPEKTVSRRIGRTSFLVTSGWMCIGLFFCFFAMTLWRRRGKGA